ncbi:transglycosylase SLT domain-containing protein [Halomonas caseinilytica]|uniref:Transglycosylase SLT domain-containing protein n=1 Tax=Halomonas caseinilytica TaxID=438744 RepID=A0A1M6T971_9GAMM|nr:transglycosylase SLT domain-containing protein [Halomonas caseinilytica]SHK53424.1 hypothetical protein SAMN05192556_103255 [Halomonas caseinilytica]
MQWLDHVAAIPHGAIRLAWAAHVDDAFAERVIEMCEDFGWSMDQAGHVMACIAFESGRTFSPEIQNAAGSGATGLIQFMPATARGLGTTTDELAGMTPTRQLDYVQDYFQPYHRRIRTLPDMYMAILLPKYVGEPGGSVLFSGGIAYRQNAGLDANSDGKITKDEASAKVQNMLVEGQRPANSRLIAP